MRNGGGELWEKMKALCPNMNCSYLGPQEDFVDSFQLYKKGGVHLNEKGLKVFARRMDESQCR